MRFLAHKNNKACPAKIYRSGGFTLVELLISLALLSTVLIVGFGLLMNINIAVRTTQSQRRVMDNLSFALEQMSRSITYGSKFSCIGAMIGDNCGMADMTKGVDNLTFETDYLGSPKKIVYSRKTTTVGSVTRGYIARSIDSGPDLAITDQKIDIQELYFYVYHGLPYGSGTGQDLEQPRVTVTIKGVIYDTGKPQEFFIQTTLSQRNLKLQ